MCVFPQLHSGIPTPSRHGADAIPSHVLPLQFPTDSRPAVLRYLRPGWPITHSVNILLSATSIHFYSEWVWATFVETVPNEYFMCENLHFKSDLMAPSVDPPPSPMVSAHVVNNTHSLISDVYRSSKTMTQLSFCRMKCWNSTNKIFWPSSDPLRYGVTSSNALASENLSCSLLFFKSISSLSLCYLFIALPVILPTRARARTMPPCSPSLLNTGAPHFKPRKIKRCTSTKEGCALRNGYPVRRFRKFSREPAQREAVLLIVETVTV